MPLPKAKNSELIKDTMLPSRSATANIGGVAMDRHLELHRRAGALGVDGWRATP